MRVGRIGVVMLLGVLASPLAALAQVDFAGEWENRRLHENNAENQPVGDYSGAPINEAARLRADSWDAGLLTLPEHQCQPHGADRMDNFTNLRIWKEVDLQTQRLAAYHLNVEWMSPHRVVYMDGRPHPSEYAAHTYTGFSTGRIEGNTLIVTTTHLKEAWFRRNGLPRSERATVIERFMRHGDMLTWVTVIRDPVYLTEPFIRSSGWIAEPTMPPFRPYPCQYVEEIVRPVGVVPHHLPGTNDQLTEWATTHGIPQEAARGGAETMYPEYRQKLRAAQPARPVSSR